MKKFISVLLTLLFVFQFIPELSPVHAQEPIVLFSEDFNSIETNGIPSNMKIGGSINNRVVEKTKSNKILKLDLSSGIGTISVPISLKSKKLWVGVKYRADFPINKGGLITLKSNAGIKNEILSFSKDGVQLNYGKPFNRIGLGKWNDVAVCIDTKAGVYDVYVDGNCCITDWKLERSTSSVSSVDFEFVSTTENKKETVVEIDDVRIWEGNDYRKSFPVSQYNTEIIPFNESKKNDSTKFYIANDYETVVANGMNWTNQLNPNVIFDVVSEDGNYYFRAERSSGTGGYFEFVPSNVNSYFLTIEFDYKVFYNEGNYMEFMDIRDAAQTWSQDFYCDSSDMKYYRKDGKGALPIEIGADWINLAFSYNFVDKTVSVYVDKTLLYENIPMSNSSFDGFQYARLSFIGEKPIAVGVDDLYIYESEKPLDDPESKAVESLVSTFEKDEDTVKQFVGTNTVYCVDSGDSYRNGKKREGVSKGLIINNTTMVPVRTLSETFDLNVEWEQESQQVKVGENVTLTLNDKKIQIGEDVVESPVPATMVDNRVYLPLRILAEKVLGQQVLWDDSGLIFLNNKDIKIDTNNDSMIDMTYRYMMYDRIGEEAFVEKINGLERPRLLATKDKIQEVKEWIDESSLAKEWFENSKRNCENYIKREPIPFDFSTGTMNLARTNQNMAIELCVMYHLTGEEKYAEAAWKHVENICSYPHWGTAHALDAATLMIATSVVYDWLNDWLGEERRTFLAENIAKKGLMPIQKQFTSDKGGSFIRNNDNWVSVVNSGIILACIAIGDDERYKNICADVFKSATIALEYIFKPFAPDGAWYEGPGYTIYTMHYLKHSLSTLNNVFGNCLNYTESKGFKNAPWFLLDMSGPMGFNSMHNLGLHPIGQMKYADEGVDGLWWASCYDDANLTAAILNHMKLHDIAGGAQELIAINPEHENTALENISLDNFYGETEYGVLRGSHGSIDSIWASFHGGSNNFGHSHLDAGTFMLDALGERWATDIGSDSYSLPEWGAQSGKYYVVRAEGHNVCVINPDETGGQDCTTTLAKIIEKGSQGKAGGYAIVDLSPDYTKNATSAKRGFALVNNRQSMLIRDEIELKKDDSEIYWFMHLEKNTDVQLFGNYAILTKNGKQLRLDFVTNAGESQLSEMTCDPLPTSPQDYPATYNLNDYYKKIAIKTKASGKFDITVKLTPITDGALDFNVENIALADWKTLHK